MTTPRACPKFSTCGAPYCPLDPDRSHTTTLHREPSCLYLREASKVDGNVPSQFRQTGEESLALVMAGTEGGEHLRTVLQRAAKQGSSRAKTCAL